MIIFNDFCNSFPLKPPIFIIIWAIPYPNLLQILQNLTQNKNWYSLPIEYSLRQFTDFLPPIDNSYYVKQVF